MRGRLLTRSAFVGFLGLTSVVPGAAFAGEPASAKNGAAAAAALEKGRQGVELYEHGSWQEALQHFQAAESLYHSPVFLLYAARSLRNAGRFSEAKAVFARVTAEQLGASAPEPWQRAQADARIELEKLEQQLAAAAAATSPPARKTPPVAAKPRVKAETYEPGPYVPGLVIAGVGSAALVAGGVVGVMALNKASTAKRELMKLDEPSTGTDEPSYLICRGSQCLQSQQGAVEPALKPASDLALAADVLWISGAAVAAVGLVLVLIDPRAEPTVSANAGPGRASFRLKF